MWEFSRIEKNYELSREQFSQIGVDTEKALEKFKTISLSIHCWQGDDVAGFEKGEGKPAGGGILVTGNYPGKARNIEELKADLQQAFALIPGSHRLNLHAIYGDFGGKTVERNEIEPEHFRSWVDWAKKENLKLDFNSTCFSHPKANSGYTLSSRERDIRKFWIEHVKRCRKISAFMGRELRNPCLHNLWIPDGSKDIPVDRWTPRTLLKESLNEIFAIEYSPSQMKDSLESKLFGIGSESYVVGSHEFYLGYAISRGKMVCLDLGHYHPTESVADKISAILQYSDEILLHLSRPVRWDSDHVVILNDDIREVTREIVRSRSLEKIHLSLDFFDASMNRIGAWVIGARATLKGLLMALLEPEEKLKETESSHNHFKRLALLEELNTLPFGSVWDYYCLRANVPPSHAWIKEVENYEKRVLSKRS